MYNKILSFVYFLLIISFATFAFQLYTERGAGLVTGERIVYLAGFLIALAFVGVTHHKISTSSTRNVGLMAISSLNALLSFFVIYSLFFVQNNGGMSVVMMGAVMLLTLLISVIFSVVALKKPNPQPTG